MGKEEGVLGFYLFYKKFNNSLIEFIYKEYRIKIYFYKDMSGLSVF